MSFLVITMLVFAADRLTKPIASAVLTGRHSVEVIPGIFNLTLVHNTGAAFGLMKDQRLFFIFVTVIAVVSIIYYIWRRNQTKFTVLLAFGLVMGGALGNLLDRIKYGYVVDFLDFRIWPVFNIADSSITIGAILLAFILLRTNS